MAAPRPEALSGRASYRGTLVGYAPDGSALHGDADLGVDFGRGTGEARFHRITDWEGSWWNRSGYRYGLSLYGHYFDSSGDPQDRDGIPDVTGAFYGFEAEPRPARSSGRRSPLPSGSKPVTRHRCRPVMRSCGGGGHRTGTIIRTP